MFLYILLLSLIAFFAYVIGSIGTMRVAGQFVFHRNLNRLGKGNVWISNFRRLFGIPGFVKLTLVEIVKDLIPLLLGALILGAKGQSEVGRAFAGFCLLMGRLWPVFNRYNGCHGCVALALVGMLIEPSVGAAAAVVTAAGIWFSRSISLGAVLGAIMMIITTVLVVEDGLSMNLLIACAALVIVRHLPALLRLSRGQEERLSFKEDLTYKLDSKF